MSGEQSHDVKERALRDTLASLDSVIVAYSGGVDSAYLAYIAHRTLGDRALAVTAESPSYPERHRSLAIRIARDFGLRHEIIHTSELERPEYRANPSNRKTRTRRPRSFMDWPWSEKIAAEVRRRIWVFE